MNLNNCRVAQDLLEQTTFESEMEITTISERHAGCRLDICEPCAGAWYVLVRQPNDHQAIFFEICVEPQGKDPSCPKPRKVSGWSTKALDEQTFIEVLLD